MTQHLRLELPVLLPDVADGQDACVARLEAELGDKQGISRVHVVRGERAAPMLCIHYDPARLSIEQARRVAARAGAEITARYGHAVLPVRAVDGEDAPRRIEA